MARKGESAGGSRRLRPGGGTSEDERIRPAPRVTQARSGSSDARGVEVREVLVHPEDVADRVGQFLSLPPARPSAQDLDACVPVTSRRYPDRSGTAAGDGNRGRERAGLLVDLQRREGRQAVRGDGPEEIHRLAARTDQANLESGAHRPEKLPGRRSMNDWRPSRASSVPMSAWTSGNRRAAAGRSPSSHARRALRRVPWTPSGA